MVLEKINQVGDIKKIPPEEYDTLAEEIRHFLIREDQPERRTSGFQSGCGGAYDGTPSVLLIFRRIR